MRIIDDKNLEPDVEWGRGSADPSAARRRTVIEGVCYKIAGLPHEREGAFRLVYQAYVSLGLMQPNASGLRFDFRHLLPDSPIFIAKSRGSVICTMSLFPDRGMGLILERTFFREIAEIRESCDKLAEVSCLASRRGHFSRAKMFDVFVNLVGLMFQYARYHGISKLLIAVHPRHGRFYERMLGFDVVGTQRPYARVGGHPAVACLHDFDRRPAASYPLKTQIDQLCFAPWELLHRPMTASERHAFLLENVPWDRLAAA